MMKIRILSFVLILLLAACSADKEPVIGVTMVYRPNSYSVHKTYVDAVRENGGRARLIPCSEDEALLRKELSELDGIIFIGGRDYDPAWYGKEIHPSMAVMDPHRGRFDSLFIQLALESGKPILGVCAGEQLIAIATGGKLIRDIPDHRGVEHMIRILPDSKLQALYGDSMLVNSWHHQCVEPEFLNPDFRITAWSADSIVEAIEYSGKQWILGTQFHPERLEKAERDKIFKRFIREAAK